MLQHLWRLFEMPAEELLMFVELFKCGRTYTRKKFILVSDPCTNNEKVFNKKIRAKRYLKPIWLRISYKYRANKMI